MSQDADLTRIAESGARAALMLHSGVTRTCPHCGAERSAIAWQTIIAGRRGRCSSCDAQSTWAAGTPFAGSRLSCVQLLQIVTGHAGDADTARLAHWLGLDHDTVRAWYSRLDAARRA